MSERPLPRRTGLPAMPRLVSAALLATTTAASPALAQDASPPRNPGVSRLQTDKGVANLPFARGKSFTTLDGYLAHLETLGAIDLPWWREIEPGVYEHVIAMRGAKREVATREQLMQRFGFAR